MEPFSIQCDGCQATLKVTRATLIGKRVPCPKCQTPVLVAAPADDLAAESAEPAETSFDDVDQLLAGLPTPTAPTQSSGKSNRAKRQTPAPADATSQSSDQRPRRAASPSPPDAKNADDTATASQPVTAAQPWDNPAATQARRRLTWIVATIGTLLMAGLLGSAWLMQDTGTIADPIEEVAQVDPPEPQPPLALETEEPLTAEPVETNLNEPAPKEGDPTTTQPDDFANPASEVSQPIAPVEKTNEQPATTSPLETEAPILTSNHTEPELPKHVAPNPQTALRDVAPAETSLDELASLLQASGSSVQAITEAAIVTDVDQTIGLPKYYFPRTQPDDIETIDIARALSEPCVGLQYKQTSLIEVLRDITLVTGVPISVDVPSLQTRLGQRRLIPLVNVNVTDSDFAGAIEQIVQPLHLTLLNTENGILLTGPHTQTPVTQTHEVAGLEALGDAGLAGLAGTIKQLIAPDSWAAQPNVFSLQRGGNQFTVTHFPFVQYRIQRFFEKTAAGVLTTANNPRDTPPKLTARLTTLLSQAATALAKPCDLAITTPSTIDELLSRIRFKTNVDVIVNWQTLGPAGWTPTTRVPGHVSEPTVAEVVSQLERSLSAKALIIDANTIELTTAGDAVDRSYIEFYHLADLLTPQFEPARIVQLVEQATSRERTPHTIGYEPRCQSLIVAAPQQTHQMIENVITKLRALSR